MVYTETDMYASSELQKQQYQQHGHHTMEPQMGVYNQSHLMSLA